MKVLSANEVCQWLQLSVEQLRQLRRRRDSTQFPPPILGEAGLAWFESDISSWVAFVNDWQEAGATLEALDSLISPTYLSIEPEARCAAPSSKE